jgi:hypothetical protein
MFKSQVPIVDQRPKFLVPAVEMAKKKAIEAPK